MDGAAWLSPILKRRRADGDGKWRAERSDGGRWLRGDAVHRMRWSRRRGREQVRWWGRLAATVVDAASDAVVREGDGREGEDDMRAPSVSERGEWRWVGSGWLGVRWA